MPVARRYADNLTPYQRGFCDLVANRNAFALVSLRLDPGHDAWFPNKLAAWNYVWPMVGKLFLRLDQGFHETRFVVKGVPPERRFDGICVLEKPITRSFHLHIATFCQEQLSDEERDSYLCFLLTRANTEAADKLEPMDLRLLKSRNLAIGSMEGNITQQLSARMTCHVRGVDSQRDLAIYLAKEVWQGHASSCSDFRTLNEFYSKRHQHTQLPRL